MKSKVRNRIAVTAGAILAFLSAGCASIVSGNKTYRVPVHCNVNGATVTIRDTKGKICDSIRTPGEAKLRADEGAFSSASYTLTFEKYGYSKDVQLFSSGVNGWFWGNLAFGPFSIIGFCVDANTGAMWAFNEERPVNGTIVRIREPKSENRAGATTNEVGTVNSPVATETSEKTQGVSSGTSVSPDQRKNSATEKELRQLLESGVISKEEYGRLIDKLEKEKGTIRDEQ